MTASDLIAAFNELDVATYPVDGEDEDWRGQPVLKLSVVLAVLGRVASQLEHERYGDLVRPC